MTTPRLYAQGDILLEPVPDVARPSRRRHRPGQQRIVLAHGEVTGHMHRIEQGAVMFRDDALARDLPAELYIRHLQVTAPSADLVHEEHDTIVLPRGTYRVRRQREFDPDTDIDAGSRLVED